jgi:hypothetical protein
MENEGNGYAVRVPVATLELTYVMATGAFTIKGDAESTDVFLNMLAQATRHIEARFRAEQVGMVSQQLAEQAHAAAIAARLRKGS